MKTVAVGGHHMIDAYMMGKQAAQLAGLSQLLNKLRKLTALKGKSPQLLRDTAAARRAAVKHVSSLEGMPKRRAGSALHNILHPETRGALNPETMAVQDVLQVMGIPRATKPQQSIYRHLDASNKPWWMD